MPGPERTRWRCEPCDRDVAIVGWVSGPPACTHCGAPLVLDPEPDDEGEDR